MKKTDPQQQSLDLIERIRTLAPGLFAITTGEAEFVTREKGRYAYLLAKPSKRLANVLSVDRELLILISTFEDQQQRTIKVARELIAKYEGRLESTVAILVHNDREGNLKLQKWGRSVGFAVLPIYAAKMPSNSEQLERQLCNELFSHDPFDVTGPVSDDENFFGRRNEALDLARKLQTGQIRSCLGIRKIGKTSVINRIINEARRSYDCYCVALDCSRDQIWSQTAAGLISALADATRAAIVSSQKYATVGAPTQLGSIGDASAALQQVMNAADKPVLIFVDEVDYITPGSPTAAHWSDDFNSFWRNLRAIYQEAMRENKPISMMVGGVSSKWFAMGSINGIENAALALIPEEYLSPLSRGATIAMIKKIARSAGLSFIDETADIISAACSDMPFWVRKACSFIHRHVEIAERPMVLQNERVKTLVSNFIEQEGATLAQVALTHLFRVYPEVESSALACLTVPAENTTARLVTTLRKYGILAPNEPVRPSGEMVRQALILYQEQRESAQISLQMPLAIAPGVKDKAALDDWADDLAVINKGRNILERKLRQLVLNFLRVDALASKKRGTTKDRILESVSSEKRTKLNHLSADDVVEHLLWTELANLIVKEWSLFSSVFSDRKQFEQHAEVVNERYDAHAKDADSLDLGLYRRSLKWLSDRIASV